jgi:hypothetical protein
MSQLLNPACHEPRLYTTMQAPIGETVKVAKRRIRQIRGIRSGFRFAGPLRLVFIAGFRCKTDVLSFVRGTGGASGLNARFTNAGGGRSTSRPVELAGGRITSAGGCPPLSHPWVACRTEKLHHQTSAVSVRSALERSARRACRASYHPGQIREVWSGRSRPSRSDRYCCRQPETKWHCECWMCPR